MGSGSALRIADAQVQRTIEELRQWVANGQLWIVALAGEQWVGLSVLTHDMAKPDEAATVLTGVVNSHRRRGIATALKVAVFKRARQACIRRITTQNEENNPMLQLNLRLGFREGSAWVLYRKEL